MKLRAYYESNGEANGIHCAGCRFLGLGSAIKIYNPQRTTEQTYSTTMHELAHASHWRMDKNSYKNSIDKIVESWARRVEWQLTRMVYPDYLGRAPNPGAYTLIVADMIDGSATASTRTNWGLIDSDGLDAVEGYTIKQIENTLIGQTSWYDWRDNIKNKYNNATENNLDVLFGAYR